jgi:acetyl-CoA decarbonylase/synthase complex subunit delta
MPIEIPKDKWPGSIRPVTIGATAADGGTRSKTVTVGGETTLPYMQFEAAMPHAPAIAIEIKSRRPEDWSPLLNEAWGDVMGDAAQWAKKAEAAGADIIALALTLEDTPEDAVRATKAVLGGLH